jgi:hypothetical protein
MPYAQERVNPSAGEGVDPTRLYPLDTLMALLGWTPSTFRAAVRRGLPVHRDGKRAYVMGQDVIDHLTAREVNR